MTKMSVALVGAFVLMACGSQLDSTHDNLSTCFKPDDERFYSVDAGSPCNAGDHLAYACYLPSGKVIGVFLQGYSSPNLACRAQGGILAASLITSLF